MSEKTMRAARVASPTEPRLDLVDLPVPQPGRGEMRIKVGACGICHSDFFVLHNAFPGITYPRVPGHEIAGTVEALGDEVTGFAVGDRVGVGWHGGHDGTCDRCRRGDFLTCRNLRVPGMAYDGGYEQYMVAPQGAVAHIPDGLSLEDAAPLMCAGVTTYNSLRHSEARPGDLVAVLGIGGLGHLGVQFARNMGFETVAIARGEDKAALATKLGAHHYIDSNAGGVAEKLQALGGARVALSTVTAADAMLPVLDGLRIDGQLIVLGAALEPLPVQTLHLLAGRQSIKGWPSGTCVDSEDTMKFAALTGIRPMLETFPLEQAQAAYDRMISGKARFRVVLTT
ncbi:MAG TPA: alcohol dehydrogenase [Candidatus Acidoferrales bacterium]|nr:alcohol dehydrogenase [Candidatus Acidoferrales bacterium]